MNNVTGQVNGETLEIALSGHIDSSNADDAEKAIQELRDQFTGSEVVVDSKALEYISSAGLRILLRLRKVYPTIRVINVSVDVYEVFEMTGFTEMITVEKAYRNLSVEGCEVIGQGSNGKVYRIDKDTIVKVYRNPDSLPDIKRETALARRAFVLGIPTAIPFDVVRVGDGYGSVFELLNAKSFAKLVNAEPDKIDTYVKVSTDLLKTIHHTEVQPTDMPDMKKVAVGYGKFLLDYLPPEEGKKLVALIEAVPERHTMIHGDFHIKNIMLQNGEVLLIDMDTLSYGHPIFEFASIYNAYIGFGITDHSNLEKFLGVSSSLAEQFYKKTMHQYFDCSEEKLAEIEKKAQLLGYARILRRTIRRQSDTAEGQALIQECKQRISALLKEVDTLDFE